MKYCLPIHFASLFLYASLSLSLGVAYADDDVRPAAADKIILEISCTNEQQENVRKGFSMAEIKLLPQTSVALELPAATAMIGKHAWQGVSLGKLIGESGCRTALMKIGALNGYSVSIPAKDIEQYNPTLVYLRDGAPISVREKGPFILIYPFNKFPELNQQIYLDRMIWQVNEITLQ